MVRPQGEVAELMADFVPVRMIQANGMDLNLFQFDYDMSFAIVFLAPDKTIYGRYGTRNRSAEGEASSEISMAGLAESMRAVKAIHADPAKHTAGLKAKSGPPAKYATPEQNPRLRKYEPEIRFGPNVAKSCIHCHQVNDTARLEYREMNKPLPDEVLFPYPLPADVFGAKFDREKRATVSELLTKSPLAPGDQIDRINGQPIVSVADIQWVLHRMPATRATLKIDKRDRAGERSTVDLVLADGWRKRSDISWRVSTWDLRRMVFGGMFPVRIDDGAKRRQLGLEGKLALHLKHVGQYGEHAVAKRAGAKKGDILIGYDGITDDVRETDLLAHGMQNRRPGDKVKLVLLRGGKKIETEIVLR